MQTDAMLWKPSEKTIAEANLTHYSNWLSEKKQLRFEDYHALWKWSVTNLGDFWESLWQYFKIAHDGTYRTVAAGDEMHSMSWFEGTYLNYAEHIFRNHNDVNPAIIYTTEIADLTVVSWKELRTSVASIQDFLKSKNVVKGDRVAAYLPCTPEATIAMLATVSIGAIWSSCSPDFGIGAVIDRFAQIDPKVLIAVDHYSYAGKSFDKRQVVKDLLKNLPSVEHVILISENQEAGWPPKVVSWEEVSRNDQAPLEFVRVPFSHPLWVLYSSGTTGLPKAFVHSHGGILMEQLKYCSFHNDFKTGERCFWYTTTGWMMWNYIHGALLVGATMVLYDGSIAYPDLNTLWKFAQDAGINHFGTSAGFLLANLKADIHPGAYDLSSIRSLSSTGSTLPPEAFEWVYKNVGKDIWLVSMSGGSDVCSAFVGGNPTLPVFAGEIQCRALGCDLYAHDESGIPVQDEVGEMVIKSAMPSMPVYFWNDPDHKRYKESYFEMFPNVWRHGDWIKITSHQGVIIYGRSDATLNRAGVRIGTSEIYRAMDKIDEVGDSLIICIEKSNGEFWMPLFVVMKKGQQLTSDLEKKIKFTLRNEYSPRHVPDEIISVSDIPYTISGKKTETPVKKIFMGIDPEKALSAGVLKNPASMNAFIALAKARL
jgi:acetoacetyl-CoA synthetase